MSRKKKPLAERFWGKVRVLNEDECWPWLGSRLSREGGEYGQFSVSSNGRRKMWKAHRVAYSLKKGRIPVGLLVMHSCDTPWCVNPKHLSIGTNTDNMVDMALKGRAHKMFGSENPAFGKPSPNDSGDSMRGKKHSAVSKARISASHLKTRRKI